MTINSHKNRWIQGYMCAVAALIQQDGDVSTQAKELFRGAGIKQVLMPNGNGISVIELRKLGIDEHDIDVFKQYEKELAS